MANLCMVFLKVLLLLDLLMQLNLFTVLHQQGNTNLFLKEHLLEDMELHLEVMVLLQQVDGMPLLNNQEAL